MAVGTIKIDKLHEIKNVGYYKISTEDYESKDLFLAIDKNLKSIKLYLDKDFLNPIKEITTNKYDEKIGSLPGIHMRVYTGAIIKALKILHSESFPDKESYTA